MNVNVLKRRWTQLEDKAQLISSMMSELEEKFGELNEEHDIKLTTIYVLMQKELKLTYQEQDVIEKSGALSE